MEKWEARKVSNCHSPLNSKYHQKHTLLRGLPKPVPKELRTPSLATRHGCVGKMSTHIRCRDQRPISRFSKQPIATRAASFFKAGNRTGPKRRGPHLIPTFRNKATAGKQARSAAITIAPGDESSRNPGIAVRKQTKPRSGGTRHACAEIVPLLRSFALLWIRSPRSLRSHGATIVAALRACAASVSLFLKVGITARDSIPLSRTERPAAICSKANSGFRWIA